MMPAAALAHSQRLDAAPRPLSPLDARLDLALLAGYPEPLDRAMASEPWRLALRWGWSVRRVQALLLERRAAQGVAHVPG